MADEERDQGILARRATALGDALSPEAREKFGLPKAEPLARPLSAKLVPGVKFQVLETRMGQEVKAARPDAPGFVDRCVEEFEALRKEAPWPSLRDRADFVRRVAGYLASFLHPAVRVGDAAWRRSRSELALVWYEDAIQTVIAAIEQAKEPTAQSARGFDGDLPILYRNFSEGWEGRLTVLLGLDRNAEAATLGREAKARLARLGGGEQSDLMFFFARALLAANLLDEADREGAALLALAAAQAASSDEGSRGDAPKNRGRALAIQAEAALQKGDRARATALRDEAAALGVKVTERHWEWEKVVVELGPPPPR